MAVNLRSSLYGFGFLVFLKVDKYFVVMCCLFPKRRSNLVDKAATFYTRRERNIDILVTPDRIFSIIISFLMSHAVDIVVLIFRAMMVFLEA
jgi:hypothetical protein